MTLLAPPPTAQAGRLHRLALPLAAGAAAAVGALALHVRDPHAAGSWGYCPTALLGFSCPLCGSLRAVNDLTHLDLAAAASSNLLLVLAIPVIVALWGRRLVACWRGGAAFRPLSAPRAVWVALAVVVLAFTVARNLPVGAWLAP
jgi:Protein of unknown function (DUF2752)